MNPMFFASEPMSLVARCFLIFGLAVGLTALPVMTCDCLNVLTFGFAFAVLVVFVVLSSVVFCFLVLLVVFVLVLLACLLVVFVFVTTCLFPSKCFFLSVLPSSILAQIIPLVQ